MEERVFRPRLRRAVLQAHPDFARGRRPIRYAWPFMLAAYALVLVLLIWIALAVFISWGYHFAHEDFMANSLVVQQSRDWNDGVLYADSDKDQGIDGPVKIWMDRISEADQAERRKILSKLLPVLESPGGHGRLAAVDVLLRQCYNYPDDLRGTNAAEVIAKNLVEIAEPRPEGITVTVDALTERRIEALAVPIEPRVVTEVNGWRVILVSGLPQGWTAENGQVILDGKVIAERAKYPVREYGHSPREPVDLARYLPSDPNGELHTLISKIVIVAPDGTRVPLERKLEFTLWKR